MRRDRYWTIALVLTLGFIAFFLRRAAIPKEPQGFTMQWVDWTKLSAPFLLAQLGHGLVFMLLPVAFAYVSTEAEMGNFSAAFKLAAMQLIAFNAVGIYASPRFADLHGRNDRKGLIALCLRLFLFSFALSLPLFLFFVAFPVATIETVYGAEYPEAATVLPLLALGVFFHAGTGPLGNFLLMSGAAKFYNTAAIIVDIIGLMAMYLLAENDIMRAAYCVAGAFIVWKSAIVARTLWILHSWR